MWFGPAIFHPFILDESSKEDYNLFALGFDAIGDMNIDKGDTIRCANPLQVHCNTIRHDVGSRVSSKLIVVTTGNTEGIEGLSNVARNRITSD